MLFVVVRFSSEALARWHSSLHNSLHKDRSALFSIYVVLLAFFL